MAKRGPSERQIKRYENRKLYDTHARRYVTLTDLARLIGRGEEVHVVHQKSGEDLTAAVLAQVILEGIKERTASIPRQVLSRLIRLGFGPAGAAREWSRPQEASARVRAEAERIASELMARGRLSLEEALALRQEITRSVARIVSDAQHSFEDRIHRLLERGEREGGVGPSLKGLRERLLAFETYLAAPAAGGRKRAVARTARRDRTKS